LDPDLQGRRRRAHRHRLPTGSAQQPGDFQAGAPPEISFARLLLR
jgi:hypothetical protein